MGKKLFPNVGHVMRAGPECAKVAIAQVTMKTMQATNDLTLELYLPPPAGEPFLVLRSKAAEIDEECSGVSWSTLMRSAT